MRSTLARQKLQLLRLPGEKDSLLGRRVVRCLANWNVTYLLESRLDGSAQSAGPESPTSERDVVVGANPDRGLLEVGGVGGDVRLDCAVRLGSVTRAQELDRVGNDIDGLPLRAV